jgi:Transglycosylase SLT domain
MRRPRRVQISITCWATAMRESSLKPNAQSSTSSATGLFQFIDQTWLGVMKEHGAQHGIGNLASAITRDANGFYSADAAQKQSILALLSAIMGPSSPAW